MSEPIVRVTRHEVNLLPDGVPDRELFGMDVVRHVDGRWSVRRGEHRTLGADGTWSWGYRWCGGDREPETEAEWDDYHAGRDAWVAEHRFDEQTALKLAREAAPHMRVNRWTAADVLRDWQQREAS